METVKKLMYMSVIVYVVVSIGHFPTFYVVLFPLKYVPSKLQWEQNNIKSRKMTNADYYIYDGCVKNKSFFDVNVGFRRLYSNSH